jgi:hypothetical protein
MPILVSEYNQLVTRLAEAEARAERVADPELRRQLDAAIAALGKAETELAALRAVARGYRPQCGRGDAAPTVTDWEAERQRADEAEAALAQVRLVADLIDAGAPIVGSRQALAARLRDAAAGHADATRSEPVVTVPAAPYLSPTQEAP